MGVFFRIRAVQAHLQRALSRSFSIYNVLGLCCCCSLIGKATKNRIFDGHSSQILSHSLDEILREARLTGAPPELYFVYWMRYCERYGLRCSSRFVLRSLDGLLGEAWIASFDSKLCFVRWLGPQERHSRRVSSHNSTSFGR